MRGFVIIVYIHSGSGVVCIHFVAVTRDDGRIDLRIGFIDGIVLCGDRDLRLGRAGGEGRGRGPGAAVTETVTVSSAVRAGLPSVSTLPRLPLVTSVDRYGVSSAVRYAHRAGARQSHERRC